MPSFPPLRAGLEAVLFDLDGVVIDSEPLHLRSKRLTFAEYGLRVPDSAYAAFYGRTDRDVIGHVVARYGPHLDPEEVIARKQAVYASLVGEMPLVPDVERFIEAVEAAGIRRALVTSASPSNQRLAFEKFGLGDRFELVLTAADVARPKPHPDPYLRAVEAMGLEAGACLVVEDSVNGVRSGVAAGCAVAGLTTSFSAEALREAGARPVVATYRELAREMDLRMG